jgi:uncharacterized membrane protein
LEISFPVKVTDIGDFIYAAQKTVNGFDVMPNCTGESLKKTTAEVLFEGPGWKLYRTTDYGHGAHARQGCVIYPLDRDAITGLSPTQRELLRAPIYIDFPIGELEITASREGLGYDATTCANIVNIVKRLDAIESDVMDHFKAQFDGLKTYWDVVVWFNELNHLALPDAIKNILRKFQFKGRRSITTSIYVDGYKFRKIGTQYQRVWRRGAHRLDETTADRHLTRGQFQVFTVGKDEVVSAMQGRINLWCDMYRDVKTIYVVRADDNSFSMKKAVALFSGMPTTNWIKLSDLPKPTQDSAYVKKPVQAEEITDNCKKVTIDLNAGGYYVPMQRKEILYKDAAKSANDVRRLTDALKALDIIPADAKVYGIPATLKRCYEKEGSTWVNLFDLALDTITTNSDKFASIGRLNELNSYFGTDNSRLHAFVKAILKKGNVGGKSLALSLPMGRFALYYRAHERLWNERETLKRQNFQAYLTLANVMYFTIVGKAVPDILVKIAPVVTRAYPMLEMVFEGMPHYRDFNDNCTSRCLDYVLLVDGK